MELVPLLKFHNNHIIKCPMCKSSLINNLATRIIGGERTKVFKCLLCFFSFRCCGKLKRNTLSLSKILLNKKEKEYPYRTLQKNYMLANFIVENPLIVQDSREVRASWYKTHFKLSPF